MALRLTRIPVGVQEGLDPNTNLDPKRNMKQDNPYSTVPIVPVDPATTALCGEGEPPFTEFPSRINPAKLLANEERLPYKELIFWLNDDTGCDICTITKSDVLRLKAASEVKLQADVTLPPLLGYVGIRLADGAIKFEPVRAMQINIPDHDGNSMLLKDYDMIEVCIADDQPNDPNGPVRLLGPWLRHRFYTATAPDRTNRLWIVKKRRRLANLPDVTAEGSGDLPSVVVRRNIDTYAALKAEGEAAGNVAAPGGGPKRGGGGALAAAGGALASLGLPVAPAPVGEEEIGLEEALAQAPPGGEEVQSGKKSKRFWRRSRK